MLPFPQSKSGGATFNTLSISLTRVLIIIIIGQVITLFDKSKEVLLGLRAKPWAFDDRRAAEDSVDVSRVNKFLIVRFSNSARTEV